MIETEIRQTHFHRFPQGLGEHKNQREGRMWLTVDSPHHPWAQVTFQLTQWLVLYSRDKTKTSGE